MNFLQSFKNAQNQRFIKTPVAEFDESCAKNPVEDVEDVEDFRKGDFIKIVFLKDSPLNQYKGYYGEIRHYKKGCNSCVLLEGMNSNVLISFPNKHFIKRNLYSH